MNSKIFLVCSLVFTTVRSTYCAGYFAHLTVVCDDMALLKKGNYSLLKNIAIPKVTYGIFLAESAGDAATPILFNGPLAQTILQLLYFTESSKIQKQESSSDKIKQECAQGNASNISFMVDNAFSRLEEYYEIKALKTLFDVCDYFVPDETKITALLKQNKCGNFSFEEEVGTGMIYLERIAKSLSFEKWDVFYIAEPGCDFVLVIPKSYIQARASTESTANTIGLAIDDTKLCTPVNASNIASIIKKTAIACDKNSSAIVTVIKKLIKKPSPVAWNILFFGHGGKSKDTASAAITEKLSDQSSLMAGMKTASFLSILDFLSTINTQLISWITCFGGGYHSQAVSQISKIGKWPFVAISTANTDEVTLVTGMSNVAHFFKGTDNFLFKMAALQPDAHRWDLYQQNIAELLVPIRALQTGPNPLIYIPGSEGFVPMTAGATIGLHGTEFNITKEMAQKDTPISITDMGPDQRITIYAENITAPLIVNLAHSALFESRVGGTADITIKKIDAPILTSRSMLSYFFKTTFDKKGREKHERGTNINLRSFQIDELHVRWGAMKFPEVNMLGYETITPVTLKKVSVIVFPDNIVPCGTSSFIIEENKTGKPFVYTLRIWPTALPEIISVKPASDLAAAKSIIENEKRASTNEMALVLAIKKNDKIKALTLALSAPKNALESALLQAIIEKNDELIIEFAKKLDTASIKKTRNIAAQLSAVPISINQELDKIELIAGSAETPSEKVQPQAPIKSTQTEKLSTLDFLSALKHADQAVFDEFVKKFATEISFPQVAVTAFKASLAEKDVRAVKRLLPILKIYGMSVEVQQAFINAIENGNVDVVRLLISAPQIPELKDIFYTSFGLNDSIAKLFENKKIMKGDVATICELLLKKFPRSSEFDAALRSEAALDRLFIVELILQNIVDIQWSFVDVVARRKLAPKDMRFNDHLAYMEMIIKRIDQLLTTTTNPEQKKSLEDKKLVLVKAIAEAKEARKNPKKPTPVKSEVPPTTPQASTPTASTAPAKTVTPPATPQAPTPTATTTFARLKAAREKSTSAPKQPTTFAIPEDDFKQYLAGNCSKDMVTELLSSGTLESDLAEIYENTASRKNASFASFVILADLYCINKFKNEVAAELYKKNENVINKLTSEHEKKLNEAIKNDAVLYNEHVKKLLTK